jgi:hypothetical protein
MCTEGVRMMGHTMKTHWSSLRPLLIVAIVGAFGIASAPVARAQTAPASPAASAANHKPGVLDRDQAKAYLPSSVYYSGQSAPVQARNSAGIRSASGKLAFFALVDTSGYSSAVQQTYQGYILNEGTLKIGDKTLPPGAYGFGFIGGDRMVIMDLGGNEIMHTATSRDDHLARPNPLQIISDASMPGHYRLYLGRSYVALSPSSAPGK